MAQSGSPDAPLLVVAASCAADSNRHDNGELATVRHSRVMASTAKRLPRIRYVARKNGAKPRTLGGTTGLIHQRGGVECYGEGASILTDEGIMLAAEIMDESDAAIAEPWLTAKWGGARNVEDTGVRQLLRPTHKQLERGIVPAPAFVKNGTGGSLTTAIQALHTIRAEAPEVRTRFILDDSGNVDLQQVETHPNPNTGLILRGHAIRPEGPLDEVLEEEIVMARTTLDTEFGIGQVALLVDASHKHAEWGGGGEAGQLAVIESLGSLMGRGVIIDGMLAETYLLPGRQSDSETEPGLSQVDRCIREEYAVDMLAAMDAARGSQMRDSVLAGSV
jgi:phospho-2-dehydro-3-deoxyheptonate aldolase